VSTALRLMTLQQAAEVLSTSKSSVVRLVKAGKLKVVPLGLSARSWRVHPADLDAFLNQNRQTCQSTNAMARIKLSSGTPARSIADLLATGRKPKLVRSRPS
jgi:excisionase family DNA binding protein